MYVFIGVFSAMAGNIIPAIATTNAIIAGLIVMEALKVISGNIEQCKAVSFHNLFIVNARYFAEVSLIYMYG